jgi:hypothetical protein
MYKKFSAILMVLLLIETCEATKVLRMSGSKLFFLHWYPNFAVVFFIGIAAFFTMDHQKKAESFSLGICIGAIIYECLQLRIIERTFDIYDIIASVFGYILFYCVLHRPTLNGMRAAARVK